MLVVFGSVAFDTIRTPTKLLQCEMGGAATYAGISASFFTKTGLLAVIGKDFPKRYSNVLSKHMNLRGLSIKDGKTFRYDGKYDKTLENRTTLKTELNVLGDFQATVPDEYRKSKFVYLANNDPKQNLKVLGEFDKVKFSMCDTIDFWIHTKRAAVKKMIAAVDAVVINDEEARLLTKEYNLVRCAKKISAKICYNRWIIYKWYVQSGNIQIITGRSADLYCTASILCALVYSIFSICNTLS